MADAMMAEQQKLLIGVLRKRIEFVVLRGGEGTPEHHGLLYHLERAKRMHRRLGEIAHGYSSTSATVADRWRAIIQTSERGWGGYFHREARR